MPGPGSYWIGNEETQAVLEVMQSGHLSRYGDLNDPKFLHKVYDLENEFSKYIGVNHAVSTSSGTSALMISMLAMGLKPGDEVIMPAYTFVASYTASIFLGVVPVLAEIDDSLTLDPNDIEHRITDKTKAIMPVHMLGNPCKMDEIMAIANKHGLMVLEDCCQAAGASYRGKKLGSFGEMAGFSLNVFKTITAGDGGVVVTNNKQMYEDAFGYHDQGHSPNRAGIEVGLRSVLGLNFRINELTGAVALEQLKKIDRITQTLREKKNKFKKLVVGKADFKFRTLNDAEGECGTLCTVIFPSKEKADQISAALGSKTISHSGWHVYYNMEHVLNWLKENKLPHTKGSYPATDDILSRSLNISVGVVDGGLGSGWGININSNDEEIEFAAKQFIEACNTGLRM